MKSISALLSTLLLMSSYVLSQPTITSSVLPSVGIEITHYIYNAVDFTPGATGANVTWDFSQMSKGQASTFIYKDPTTVPGNSGFPGANICAVQGDYKVFMKKSASEYNHQGSIYSATSYAAYNSNPQELLFFPMTYSDFRSETFSGSVDWGSFAVDRDGTTDIEADAYGTLILPHVTIPNALRVKTFDVMEDSISGAWQGRYEYTAYQWFHPEVTDAVLTWTIYKSISSTSTKIDTSGVFNDLTVLGLDDKEKAQFDITIFPNPCINEFNIELRNDVIKNITMDLIDITGRIVSHQQFDINGGHLVEKVDVTKLKSGLYTAVFIGEGTSVRKRIVLQ